MKKVIWTFAALILTTTSLSASKYIATVDAKNLSTSIVIKKVEVSIKYDENGYDPEGYNIKGFNSAGINKETGTEYNVLGYDKDGYGMKICIYNSLNEYSYTNGVSNSQSFIYNGRNIVPNSIQDGKYITVGYKQNSCGQQWSECRYSICTQDISN